jgi:SAM-dependent methyltransferase
MLDWVEKNIVPYHSNIHPLKITAGIIPLEKNSADLIFMMNVHHEIDNHQEMLRQCMEILKPGGKILIVDWRKEIINQGGPSPEYRFTTEEVKEHLLKVKFHPTQTFTLAKHFAVIAEKR